MLESILDMFDIAEMDDSALMSGGQQRVDMDGDGVADGIVTQQMVDTNDDSIADTLVVGHYLDLDGDGTLETVSRDLFADQDQDGIVDAYSTVVLQDLDNDGMPEYISQGCDYDGVGILDAIWEAADLDDSGVLTPLNFQNVSVDEELDGSAPGYMDFFEPDDASADSVIGNPEEDLDNWHLQETNSSCAVASQEFILEELTGMDFEEGTLRNIAEQNGWYDPNGGTSMEDVGNILEHMGLQVERSYNNDLDDLEECLANGGKIVVGVDSSEIWYREDDDPFGPGDGADHAIEVIGIDRSNPSQPMVIVNDSGVANGCGAMIPFDIFRDAWEDSGYFMVEAYA